MSSELSHWLFDVINNKLMQIRYRPGEIVLIRAQDLFHRVTRWMPLAKKKDDKTNPGRISLVFFTHSDVVEALKNKDHSWLRREAPMPLPKVST